MVLNKLIIIKKILSVKTIISSYGVLGFWGSGVGSVSLNNCVKCGFGMVMIVCGCGECVF